MWGLIWLVALLEQELQPVVDKCKIQEKSIPSKTISSMADNFLPPFRVIAINPCKNLMMGKAVRQFDRVFFSWPFAKLLVVILEWGVLLAAVHLIYPKG